MHPFVFVSLITSTRDWLALQCLKCTAGHQHHLSLCSTSSDTFLCVRSDPNVPVTWTPLNLESNVSLTTDAPLGPSNPVAMLINTTSKEVCLAVRRVLNSLVFEHPIETMNRGYCSFWSKWMPTSKCPALGGRRRLASSMAATGASISSRTASTACRCT